MLFSLRTKLTAMLLFASLMAALAVGGIAYWMLMQDFNATVLEHSFNNFHADMLAYITEYGSWENARRSEPFHEFVRRHRGGPGMRSPDDGPENDLAPPGPAREGRAGELPLAGNRPEGFPPPDGAGRSMPRRGPLFRFLLADAQGRVLHANGEYREGQQLDEKVLRKARALTLNGKIEVLAIPIGTPQLTEQDRGYLAIMRKALVEGLLAASALAILLGFVLGSRLGARVRELTSAIESMRTDGELRQQVPVRTRDEMGLLATAFNTMSSELAQAHAELKKTTEQVQLQSLQLKELSIRDPLTHLFNRRHFDEQAAHVYRQAVRHGRPLCVMVGDLDHFKSINDNFSHAAGDEVLRRVAELMQRNTRSSDVVARYGGEEFVIAFVESTAEQAAIRCEALRRSIEEHPWQEVHPQLRVTMSMGLSDDTSLGGVEKMLAAADARLYKAKHGGRNRLVVS